MIGTLVIGAAIAPLVAWMAAYVYAGVFFPAAIAVADIVLVFVIVRGDIRLT